MIGFIQKYQKNSHCMCSFQKNIYLCTTFCRHVPQKQVIMLRLDGGIGRSAGLKHQCRKASRFDPRVQVQYKSRKSFILKNLRDFSFSLGKHLRNISGRAMCCIEKKINNHYFLYALRNCFSYLTMEASTPLFSCTLSGK